MYFPDKPIRLGLNEDLFTVTSARALCGLLFGVHSSVGSVLFGSSPLDPLQFSVLSSSLALWFIVL